MPEGWNEFFAALDAASLEEVLFELALGMTPEWCMYAHWIGPEPEVCVVPLEDAWAQVSGDQLTLRNGEVYTLAYLNSRSLRDQMPASVRPADFRLALNLARPRP